jgi:hypothetical protein
MEKIYEKSQFEEIRELIKELVLGRSCVANKQYCLVALSLSLASPSSNFQPTYISQPKLPKLYICVLWPEGLAAETANLFKQLFSFLLLN